MRVYKSNEPGQPTPKRVQAVIKPTEPVSTVVTGSAMQPAVNTALPQTAPTEAVQEDTSIIPINEYLYFDTICGKFCCTELTQSILYSQKQIICSYSGCQDWCHDFFCQLLDLYSGSSKYNYALGTVVHKLQLEESYKAGHSEEVINWVKRNKDERRFDSAAAALAYIIKDVPAIQ